MFATENQQTRATRSTHDGGGRQNRRAFGWAKVLTPLVGLAAAGAAAIGVASPAQAAGDTRPDIRGCFTWGPSNTYYANQPVFLEWWNASTQQWKITGTAVPTNSTGCIQFNDISVGYYYRLEAYKVFSYPNCSVYDGKSSNVGLTQGGADLLYRTGYTHLNYMGQYC